MKLWKNFVFAVVVTVLTASCGNYKLATGSDIIYLDQGQEVTSMFTDYDVDIIRLQFTTITPRFHYNRPYYYYWHTRPLWLDYDFIYDPWHFGYYSFFYRPWNYWQYWMRPWQWNRPWRDSMFDGPFNNPSHNVVYNNSRRKSSSIETTIVSNRAKPRIKPIIIIPKVKPLNNSYKPISIPLFKPSNNYKPSSNSYKSSNSRPSYSSKPTNKPTSNFNKSKRNEKN